MLFKEPFDLVDVVWTFDIFSKNSRLRGGGFGEDFVVVNVGLNDRVALVK